MSEVLDSAAPFPGSLETCRALRLLALTEGGAPALSGHREAACSAQASPPKIRRLHPNAKAPHEAPQKGPW